MTKTVVSTKYQIVIPKEIREEMHIKSGQKMLMIHKNGIIHLVPDRPIQSLRGMIKKKLSLKDVREKKDRF